MVVLLIEGDVVFVGVVIKVEGAVLDIVPFIIAVDVAVFIEVVVPVVERILEDIFILEANDPSSTSKFSNIKPLRCSNPSCSRLFIIEGLIVYGTASKPSLGVMIALKSHTMLPCLQTDDK